MRTDLLLAELLQYALIEDCLLFLLEHSILELELFFILLHRLCLFLFVTRVRLAKRLVTLEEQICGRRVSPLLYVHRDRSVLFWLLTGINRHWGGALGQTNGFFVFVFIG